MCRRHITARIGRWASKSSGQEGRLLLSLGMHVHVREPVVDAMIGHDLVVEDIDGLLDGGSSSKSIEQSGHFCREANAADAPTTHR